MTSRPAARTFTGLVVLILGLALLAPISPANAVTKTVVVDNDLFSPSSLTLVVGDAVKWSFKQLHTTTSDQGFWDSGHISAGQTYTRTFRDSGSYPYHCTIHSTMHGKVLVPMKSVGTPANGYALRWSSRTSTPSSVKFDIQVKRVGTTSWSSFRTGTATRTAFFNPSGAHSYYLRARTHVGTHVSAWSPALTLKIT